MYLFVYDEIPKLKMYIYIIIIIMSFGENDTD